MPWQIRICLSAWPELHRPQVIWSTARSLYSRTPTVFLLGHHKGALSYLKIAFLRQPFSAEYEIWYHIAMVKTKKTPPHRYAQPGREPNLQLYYQTIVDLFILLLTTASLFIGCEIIDSGSAARERRPHIKMDLSRALAWMFFMGMLFL